MKVLKNREKGRGKRKLDGQRERGEEDEDVVATTKISPWHWLEVENVEIVAGGRWEWERNTFFPKSSMYLLAKIQYLLRYGRNDPIWAGIFFGTKQPCFNTSTVNTSHIGRYGTKLTSLLLRLVCGEEHKSSTGLGVSVANLRKQRATKKVWNYINVKRWKRKKVNGYFKVSFRKCS